MVPQGPQRVVAFLFWTSCERRSRNTTAKFVVLSSRCRCFSRLYGCACPALRALPQAAFGPCRLALRRAVALSSGCFLCPKRADKSNAATGFPTLSPVEPTVVPPRETSRFSDCVTEGGGPLRVEELP